MSRLVRLSRHPNPATLLTLNKQPRLVFTRCSLSVLTRERTTRYFQCHRSYIAQCWRMLCQQTVTPSAVNMLIIHPQGWLIGLQLHNFTHVNHPFSAHLELLVTISSQFQFNCYSNRQNVFRQRGRWRMEFSWQHRNADSRIVRVRRDWLRCDLTLAVARRKWYI